jgi:outer membrane protein TolC
MHSSLLTVVLHSSAFWALCASCATVDPRPDYERAAEEIRATTGAVEVFDPGGERLSAAELGAALADGLGLEEATRIALLNNRRLQSGFLALGVARADFVQSGLMRNPSLSLAFFFPDAGGRTRWTADLAASISDRWEIPLRRRVARERVDQQVLELAQQAGELVFRTREAYFDTVAARSLSALAREDAELARRSRVAVGRQVEEGMATKTDDNLAENRALQAELAVTRTQRDESEGARRLAALLSIADDLRAVALTAPLSTSPEPELEPAALVALGLRSRLDLRAAGRALAAAEETVALERRRRVPDLAAGVSAERPEGRGPTGVLLGPGATLEIPLFDQNQVQVSRAELQLAALRKEREALVAEAIQAVRAAADRASVATRAAAFANAELLPQAQRGAVLAERAYELGDTLVLAFLEAQRAVVEARRTGVETLLEVAHARIELERAVGVPLDSLR